MIDLYLSNVEVMQVKSYKEATEQCSLYNNKHKYINGSLLMTSNRSKGELIFICSPTRR